MLTLDVGTWSYYLIVVLILSLPWLACYLLYQRLGNNFVGHTAIAIAWCLSLIIHIWLIRHAYHLKSFPYERYDSLLIGLIWLCLQLFPALLYFFIIKKKKSFGLLLILSFFLSLLSALSYVAFVILLSLE